MSATSRRRRPALAVLIACAAVGLAACGDDADAGVEDGVVTVRLADFSFAGVPDEVPVGTRFEIVNDSERELHELVAVRLADDDRRPIAEVAHAAHELFEGGPPAAVLLAAPGGEQIAAVGDGVLSEPGRYLIVCSIPTGVDPEEFLAAAGTSDGPPDVGDGAPHLEHGMFTEVRVVEA